LVEVERMKENIKLSNKISKNRSNKFDDKLAKRLFM